MEDALIPVLCATSIKRQKKNLVCGTRQVFLVCSSSSSTSQMILKGEKRKTNRCWDSLLVMMMMKRKKKINALYIKLPSRSL